MPLLPDGRYVLPGTPEGARAPRPGVRLCAVCEMALTVGQAGVHAVCTDMARAFPTHTPRGPKK